MAAQAHEDAGEDEVTAFIIDSKSRKEIEYEIPRKAEAEVEIPKTETGWRWQLNGHGKYAGRYYQWVKGSNKSRKYAPGGKLSEAVAVTLPKRPGKGNRKPRRNDRSNPAGTTKRA